MRKEFSSFIEDWGRKNKKGIFLTGDLGFMALENVRSVMEERFINAGVSEQNMITMAAALASEGLEPICYSIAPFIVFRPAEQIRLDVCLHNLNVKIVGNGGGYGYGIMGSTHHAIEDIAVLSGFQNMKCFIPFCNEDVAGTVEAMMKYKGPSYLRLGFGIKPEAISLGEFQPIRRIVNGEKVVIVALGPVALNVLAALETVDKKNVADVYVVSEMPLVKLSKQLKDTLIKCKKLIVVEEHVARGGMGENLANLILKEGIDVDSYTHLYAHGYVNGLYGSQKYHQLQNQLDPESIARVIKESL